MNDMSVMAKPASTNLAIIGSVLGMGFLTQTNAGPISGFSTGNNPSKNIAPSIAELSKDATPHAIERRQGDDPSPTADFTAEQIECAETLGVDPSECTANGFFKNRTPAVSQRILQLLGGPLFRPNLTWDEVTQEMLDSFSSLDLSGREIESLNVNDFANLEVRIDLSDNNLTTLPVGIFDRSRVRTNSINLAGNDLVVPKGVFDNFDQQSDDLVVIYHESSYDDTVKIEVPVDTTPTVLFSEIAPFYTSGSGSSIKPNRPSLPETVEALTPSVNNFLITYLFDTLIDSIDTSSDNFDWIVDLVTTPDRLDCAERVMTDSATDCNLFGVYTERNYRIVNAIKDFLETLDEASNTDEEYWTPEDLDLVTKIDVSYETFVTFMGNDLDGLNNLEELYLTHNALSSLPEAIGNFTNLRHLAVANNTLTSIPNKIVHLDNLNTLRLNNNRITDIPAGLGLISSLKNLFIQNNPILLTAEYFRNLLEFQPGINLFFNDLSTTGLGNVLVDLEQNMTIATLAQVTQPFFKNTTEGSTQYLSPETLTFPNTLNLTTHLTPNQLLFFCIYLQDRLAQSELEINQKQFQLCQEYYPDFVTAPPPTTQPTQPSQSTNPSQTNNTTENAEDSKESNNIVAIAAGAGGGALALLAVTMFAICLCVCIKKRHHTSAPKKKKDFELVVSTQGESSEVLIEQFESGKIKSRDIIGLKNPNSGRTLLHNLAKKHPDLIERWVDKGKLKVERDLGNNRDLQVDNIGNSVLHVIAKHHTEVIDSWIQNKKISLETLEKIKNYKGESVKYFWEGR